MSCRWTDNVPKIPVRAVVVATFPMPAGLVFDWHTHTDHQLAWAASGLTVRTNAATWMLPPTRALDPLCSSRRSGSKPA